MTRQRELILDIVRSDKCHHTADEILELARAKTCRISRATVYNNLKALCEQGYIKKISGEGNGDRYDGSCKPHGHLICLKCGKVFDMDVPNLFSEIEKRLCRRIADYELKAKFVCDDCSNSLLTE